jgi:hypothetical protein
MAPKDTRQRNGFLFSVILLPVLEGKHRSNAAHQNCLAHDRIYDGTLMTIMRPRALCMNEQSQCTRTLIVKKIAVPAPLHELRNKWLVDACNKAGVIDEFHAASGTNCVFAPSLKMT